jgi:hypothetical protein
MKLVYEMFIDITNENKNSEAVIETIELHENGVIEETYYDINEPKIMIFLTAFWWKSDQRVYIEAEDSQGFGNGYIYYMKKENNRFEIIPNVSLCSLKRLDLYNSKKKIY